LFFAAHINNIYISQAQGNYNGFDSMPSAPVLSPAQDAISLYEHALYDSEPQNDLSRGESSGIREINCDASSGVGTPQRHSGPQKEIPTSQGIIVAQAHFPHVGPDQR